MSMFRRRQDVSQEDAFIPRAPAMPAIIGKFFVGPRTALLMPMASTHHDPENRRSQREQSGIQRVSAGFVSGFCKFVF